MGFWFLNSALTQMRDWMVVPPPLRPPFPPPRTRRTLPAGASFLLQIFSMHDKRGKAYFQNRSTVSRFLLVCLCSRTEHCEYRLPVGPCESQ
ncbi:hypothetical protein C4D60_Mb10t05520 [Musa balbisiana]|uniref:Uncharacterized protein n=1 Tax=Musa balbisiana TaxID=52838 RepID=A0A4V4H4L5_MUSBA|nr:hypothetical protein C4D60_Mb10t05520 [Musa balbisiana]